MPTSLPPAPPHLHVQPWPAAFRALVAQRHTLLLQGPMGSFFSELASLLQAHGHTVTKVHFNGGDAFFWRHPGALRFNGHRDALAGWLRALMTERGIDAMVLFGQMRPIHVIAREVARAMGVQVFVFEEGYLRPDYVTVERRGVNALSRQPRLASFYLAARLHEPVPPQPTGQGIWRLVATAALYGTAYWMGWPRFWRQSHHRCMNPLRQGFCWARSGVRHWWYAWAERGQQVELCSQALSRRWFLVPLQVHDDSQVRDHSRFDTVPAFIEEIVASFAAHAPADALLVFKHHPMDRAYSDYAALIRRLRRRHGLGKRLRYLHDQHLPTLLHHVRGVVTINSTVGLQALYHGAPVKTLADSVYQVPGLVFDGSLEQFWQAPGTVDRALVSRFRAHLVASTQLNASFYAHRPGLWTSAEPTPSELPEAPPDALHDALNVAEAASATTAALSTASARPRPTLVLVPGSAGSQPDAAQAPDPAPPPARVPAHTLP